jgi:hypothetical protein
VPDDPEEPDEPVPLEPLSELCPQPTSKVAKDRTKTIFFNIFFSFDCLLLQSQFSPVGKDANGESTA